MDINMLEITSKNCYNFYPLLTVIVNTFGLI